MRDVRDGPWMTTRGISPSLLSRRWRRPRRRRARGVEAIARRRLDQRRCRPGPSSFRLRAEFAPDRVRSAGLRHGPGPPVVRRCFAARNCRTGSHIPWCRVGVGPGLRYHPKRPSLDRGIVVHWSVVRRTGSPRPQGAALFRIPAREVSRPHLRRRGRRRGGFPESVPELRVAPDFDRRASRRSNESTSPDTGGRPSAHRGESRRLRPRRQPAPGASCFRIPERLSRRPVRSRCGRRPGPAPTRRSGEVRPLRILREAAPGARGSRSR